MFTYYYLLIILLDVRNFNKILNFIMCFKHEGEHL